MKVTIRNLFIRAFGAILFICSCTSMNKSKENDIIELGLFGNVKSLKEYSYKAIVSFGQMEKGKRERESGLKDKIIEFNRSGYIIEEYSYEPNDLLEKKIIFKYDGKHNKIEVNSYNFESKLIFKWIYEYNDKGFLTNRICFKPDGSQYWKQSFNYDAMGNLIEEIWYTPEGVQNWKLTYGYDNQGNKIEEINYDEKGSLYEKQTYSYDEKGNKIEANNYDSDLSLSWKQTFLYDDKRNIVEKNWYNFEGSVFNIKTTFEYEYDEKGNWIRRIDSFNGIPEYILEREFEYYD